VTVEATSAAGPELVEATLEEDRDRTTEALLDYLRDHAMRGELQELALEYPLRPGKGIRPALCLASCRAHGGRTEDALPAAVAIELLHNAFLVHDDICDDARLRRGRETLHVRHGVPRALSAGDALAWSALGPLLDQADSLDPGLAFDLLAEFDHLTRRTIEGHALELSWRERDLAGLEIDDYLKLVLDKTCWYSTIQPCRVGALLGSGGRADLEAIARFGFFLGAVLQIRDDVENLTDPDEARGKDFGGDVIEGKPTLILIHLLGTAPPAGREEALQLVGPAGDRCGLPRDERIRRVISLMERCGSIDYACAFADGLAGAALAEFDAAMGWLPNSPDQAFLRSLVLYLRDPQIRGR
jgi:geranylgeranyl diphosphate synthase, type II